MKNLEPIIIVCLTFIILGCSPANISSSLRNPSNENLSMMTRCVDFTTGNDEYVNKLLSKYDGWKVVYASEYTTGNKINTSMVMCFEKPYIK